MAYKKSRGYSRYAPYVRAAGKIAGRFAGSYIKSKFNKSRQPPDTGVTANYDRTTQYRKKNMPKRKKRVWKKFVRKVTAVLDKSLGTRTVVFNNKIAAQENAGFQGIAACCLYGKQGSPDGNAISGFQDMYRICNNDNDVMTKTTGTNPSKIVFGSAIIDLTMRNQGTTPIEVDVYEIDVRTDDTEKPDVIQTIAQANPDTFQIPGSAAGVGLNLRGTTLFDLPNAISMDRLSIYKKRKYFLPPGNTATLQHRDPRNHYFNAVNMEDPTDGFSSYALRKFTRLYLFVAKEIVGDTQVGVNLQVGTTRKYTYTVNQSSKALDSYNPV